MMTTEIERVLEKLIRQHGIDKVNDALEPLMRQFKWNDWQTVSNYAQRINRRIQAKSGKRRNTATPARSDAVK